MYCPKCGVPNADNASFCTSCGTLLPHRPSHGDSTSIPSDYDDDRTRIVAPPPPVPPVVGPLAPKRKPSALPFIAIGVLVAVLIGLGCILFLRQPKSKTVPVIEEEAKIETVAKPYPVPQDVSFPGDEGASDTRLRSFDWLSGSKLSQEDLEGLTRLELRILRNAVFAMHGYRFKSADLQDYFGRFSWYIPRYSDVTSRFSTIEVHNVELIRSME